MATKTVNPTEVSKFLGGLNFPADKRKVIEHAKSKGASNDVIDALNSIPERNYDNSADVSSEIGDDM